jgi:predicted DNA-binding transcriptional regulator AlpA
MSSDSKNRMLPTRSVCARYNITDRTVDRWLENGILPTPVRINGLRYWHQHELEQREREFQRSRETKAAKPALGPQSARPVRPSPRRSRS